MKNSTEPKHTPTPWSFANDEIYARNSRIIHVCVRDDMQDKTDAAFIVSAVNSHDELLAAAKDAKDMIQGWIKSTKGSTEVLKVLEISIAKAEGKL